MSSSIKNAAGLQLKRLVKDCVQKESLSSELIENWGETIYKTLVLPSLDQSLRANLGYALLPLLSLDTPETATSLLSNLFPHILQGLNPSSSTLFGTLKLIRTIYSGYTFNPILYQYFMKLIPGIAQVVYALLTNPTAETWEILEEACSCIYSVAEHFGITGKHMLIEMQNIPEFSVMLRDLISAELADPNLPRISIINVGTDIAHCRHNSAKGYVFKTINILLQCLGDYKKKAGGHEIWDNSPLVNMLGGKVAEVLDSLHCVMVLDDFEEILQLEFVSDLFNEVLQFISYIVPDSRFFEFFTRNYKNIVVNICLPLVKTNANDMESFNDNPEEFVAYSNDLCEKQQSETYKNSAVQLLLDICVYIDGALSFTWQFCFEICNFCIYHPTTTSTIQLSQYPTSALLKFEVVDLLECALLNFSVLNSIALMRRDLITYLENLFTTHLQYFYDSTPLIKNRVCLIIRFYSQILFFQDEGQFFELIKHITSKL